MHELTNKEQCSIGQMTDWWPVWNMCLEHISSFKLTYSITDHSLTYSTQPPIPLHSWPTTSSTDSGSDWL